MVDDEVDDIPEDFVFMLTGAPVADEAEEAGHTVGECLPTLFIQDRALAAASGAADDFGFGDGFAFGCGGCRTIKVGKANAEDSVFFI